MATKHKALHDELTTAFPPDVMQKWEDMVKTWNADPQAPNPYNEPVTSGFSDESLYS